MTTKQFRAGDSVYLIQYGGFDYLAYSRTPVRGTVFKRQGTTVTGSVSSAYSGSFDDDVIAQLNEVDYITDDNGNAFYQVVNYQVNNGITRPPTA
jgi:hypothetical protein